MPDITTDRLFLDTTILVKFFTGGDDHRIKIRKRASLAETVVTGSVVACEFRRTFLGVVDMLIGYTYKYSDIHELNRHALTEIKNLGRRREMATDILPNFLHRNLALGDAWNGVEAFRLVLEELRDGGWEDLETVLKLQLRTGVGCIGGCAASMSPGNSENIPCTGCVDAEKAGLKCDVAKSLRTFKLEGTLKRILDGLNNSSFPMTTELNTIKKALPAIQKDPRVANEQEPCKTLGDLLIALESASSDTIYTVNYNESAPLARILGQNLAVLRVLSTHPEIALSITASDAEWLEELPYRT